MPLTRGASARLGALLLTMLLSARLAYGDSAPAVPDLSGISWANISPESRNQLRNAYGKAVQHPSDPESIGALGMVLHALEQYELATRCYEIAENLQPGAFRWEFYLGVALAAQGRKQDSVDHLQRAVKLDPRYRPARLRLADLLLSIGDSGESETIYRAILKEAPDAAAAHFGLGRVLAARGDTSAAAASLEKACALAPDFGMAHYSLAQVYRSQKRNREANQQLTLFEAHRETAPDRDDSLMESVRKLRPQANEHLARGVRFIEQGNYSAAIPELEEARRGDPKLAAADANLLSAYVAMGDLEKAELYFHEALRKDPNCYEAYYNYGLMMSQQAKYSEARAAFEKSLAIHPFAAEAHNNLGFVLAQSGLTDEAAAQFRLAIESRPDYRDARFNLAQLLLARRETKEGIEQLTLATRTQDERTPFFLLQLAQAWLQQGNAERSLHYATAAKKGATDLHQGELAGEVDALLARLPGGARQP